MIEYQLYALYRQVFEKGKQAVKDQKMLIKGKEIPLIFEEHTSGWNLYVVSPFSKKKIIIKEDGKLIHL
ncbi:hypothetical protein [Fulvivirga ligni]|uniref:hypothetical protein n=1 Tax=Fulvivirga ligni TaxID=2904246 RepID=UPI001F3432AE|nr:hypothetical protein [Fulvivirga ligni]UII19152.1 hypothetical protein LVD16_15005 [Fulvivirga ligni]